MSDLVKPNAKTAKRAYLCTCLLLSIGIVLSGCDEKDVSETKQQSVQVATVNGEAITAADVDLSLERTFSEAESFSFDAELRQKVLDSLIASRAMKHVLMGEMSEEEVAKIERTAKAYEEELFVKEYLRKYADPQPVTATMVQEYYENNPDEFGGETLRDFELLKAPANMDDGRRDQLLQAVPNIRSAPNWSEKKDSWSDRFGLQFQQGRSKAGLLDKKLTSVLDQLQGGETSDVFYINDALHLVRVTNVTQTPPKPLAEVSGDIRRKLAPLMLREAVKKASQEAMAKVEVNRTKQPEE